MNCPIYLDPGIQCCQNNSNSLSGCCGKLQELVETDWLGTECPKCEFNWFFVFGLTVLLLLLFFGCTCRLLVLNKTVWSSEIYKCTEKCLDRLFMTSRDFSTRRIVKPGFMSAWGYFPAALVTALVVWAGFVYSNSQCAENKNGDFVLIVLGNVVLASVVIATIISDTFHPDGVDKTIQELYKDMEAIREEMRLKGMKQALFNLGSIAERHSWWESVEITFPEDGWLGQFRLFLEDASVMAILSPKECAERLLAIKRLAKVDEIPTTLAANERSSLREVCLYFLSLGDKITDSELHDTLMVITNRLKGKPRRADVATAASGMS